MPEPRQRTPTDADTLGAIGTPTMPATYERQSLPGTSSKSKGGPLDALQQNAEASSELSAFLTEQGRDLFGPASEYLKAILSNDRQAIQAATMPERRRVIDQYATAKKAIAEFVPRGGGVAGAMTRLEGDKASDLAMVGAGMRPQAAQTALSAGGGMFGQGIQASGAASQNLTALVEALQNQDAMSAQNAANWGQIAATIAMFAIMA